MADVLQFQLVSPEALLTKVEASQVQIPGMNGDFTAMPNHAPYLTTLRPGVVRIRTGSETAEFIVTGGFAEVSPDAATILAERAVPVGENAKGLIAEAVEQAEKALNEAGDDTRQAADQRLRDARDLAGRFGA